LRRVVAVAIRRDRRVRRGYKKAAKLQKNSWLYYSLIESPKQKIQGLML